ncbi:MAG: hypothetical protein ACR2FN_00215 [Chitinophagaceae bacterium]
MENGEWRMGWGVENGEWMIYINKKNFTSCNVSFFNAVNLSNTVTWRICKSW